MNLCIVVFTYAGQGNVRGPYAERTIRSTMENIRYTRGPISLHIADDGSSEGYREYLAALAKSYDINVTVTNAERMGYGASYNLATQVTHLVGDYLLCLEDDWELTHPLDLDLLSKILDSDEVGCLRLGYLGFTERLQGHFAYIEGQHILIFDPASPERHVFAGHPRLETRKWQRDLGPWAEGLNPGATEFDVAGRPASRENVGWPLDLVRPYGDAYVHIGTIQARDDQR